MARMIPRMGSHGLVTIRATLVIVVVMLFASPVMPARALGSPLAFSTDGVTWASTPPEALLADDVVLVPGGSATATLHLRSTAPTRGALDVTIINVRASDPATAESFGLEVVSDTGSATKGAGVGLARTRFADLTENTPVSPTVTFEPGQHASFTVTIDLDDQTTGSTAQNSYIGLGLAIGYRDAVAGGSEQPDGTPGLGTAPPQVVPFLPPGDTHSPGSGDGAARPSAGEPAESAGTKGPSAEPAATAWGWKQPADDPSTSGRDLLSVTGVARAAILTALSVTVLGVLLLLASRIRRDRSEASGS